MNKTILFTVIFAILGLSAYLLYQESESYTGVIQLTDSSSTSISNEAAKTDEEVRAELIEKGSENLTALIKEERENKKKNDSIHVVNRKPYWVYVIGTEKSSPRDFEEQYKLMKGIIPHLYLFKRTKKNYFLVKYDGFSSKQELLANKETVSNALKLAGINETLHIFNLTDDCDAKDEIRLDGAVKVSRGERIDCFVCE